MVTRSKSATVGNTSTLPEWPMHCSRKGCCEPAPDRLERGVALGSGQAPLSDVRDQSRAHGVGIPPRRCAPRIHAHATPTGENLVLDQGGSKALAPFDRLQCNPLWSLQEESPKKGRSRMKVKITFHNANPDTIWNRLAAKLGREPTHQEATAEVRRILSEVRS